MTTQRSALIVGAAPAPGAATYYGSLIRTADLLVAADGGGLLCLAAGRKPDLWVGDFDSVPSTVAEQAERDGVTVLRYAVEKDASDLDLALDAARESGVASVTFTAAFSERLDHTIAAIGTLFRSADLDSCAREPSFSLYALDARARPRVVLAEQPGTVISLFSADSATRVTVEGVQYPLDRADLPRFTSLGLSNAATLPEQRIAVLAGRVLVVVGAA